MIGSVPLQHHHPHAAAMGTHPAAVSMGTGGSRSPTYPPEQDPTAPHDPSLILRVGDSPDFSSPRLRPVERSTTLVYCPVRRKTAVVKNILIPKDVAPTTHKMGGGGGGGGMVGPGGAVVSPSSGGGGYRGTGGVPRHEDMMMDTGIDDPSMMMMPGSPGSVGEPKKAYWMQRTLRNAIYGKVRYGVVLRQRPRRVIVRSPGGGAAVPQAQDEQVAEWEVTEEPCAIKEMDWNKIRQYHGRHAENPLNEVGALQFLMEEHRKEQIIAAQEQEDMMADEMAGVASAGGEGAEDENPPRGASPTPHTTTSSPGSDHVLIPMDIVSDDKNLYVVMPYCDGGELFDLLDETDKFSEREARYWMRQIILALDHLQRVGICHRDISLENLLVHDRKSLVIDLGMCLRVPYEFGTAAALDPTQHRGRRLMIPPSGTCGKWHYMSPEIYANDRPFDGYAVDLWAAGVILFLMVTGFPPWERSCNTDERFRYLTQGYMVQLLTQWDMGLSPELMDLLAKMLHQDPEQRITLAEVWDHPWMSFGRSDELDEFESSEGGGTPTSNWADML